MDRLTKAEADILRQIVIYTNKNECFPRNKELEEIVGVSKAKISGNLSSLEAKGYITRQNRKIVSMDDSAALTIYYESIAGHIQETLELMKRSGIKKIEDNGAITFTKEEYDTISKEESAKELLSAFKCKAYIPKKKTPKATVEVKEQETAFSKFRKLFSQRPHV